MGYIRITGIFLIAFLAASIVMAALYLPQAVKDTENPTLKGLLHGTWAPGFEKSLNDALPVEDLSRDSWGEAEFSLFGQGRKGVVVGENGWLFTDEEFECPKEFSSRVSENLDYIVGAADRLQKQGIRVAVVLVPAKVRLYPEHLGAQVVPGCRTGIYAQTLAFMQKHNIQAVDLLTPMVSAGADKDGFFLHTDTHWSPAGAGFAAKIASEQVSGVEGDSKTYQTSEGADGVHEGDLLRYLPGVPDRDIKRDAMHAFTTEASLDSSESGADDAALALFGDDIPPIALVGTSYSANLKWHFLGFLKEYFEADILNMADEGRGPFTVMEKYLRSDALKNTPPKLVIWEIPERYMTSKPDIEAELKEDKEDNKEDNKEDGEAK
ncbi:MAG: hypothetical protein KDI13_06600 [Alphaproteobacteria bacterium]|nr:hypothetical protein [Alphaproteobacteria bacterium]